MKYLINGFSPKMLGNQDHTVQFETITKDEFKKNKKDCISAIGHKQLARELNVPYNRFNIQLEPGDEAYLVTADFGRRHGFDHRIPIRRYRRITLLN